METISNLVKIEDYVQTDINSKSGFLIGMLFWKACLFWGLYFKKTKNKLCLWLIRFAIYCFMSSVRLKSPKKYSEILIYNTLWRLRESWSIILSWWSDRMRMKNKGECV